MSVTMSSPTKTITRTSSFDTGSNESPEQDRWTHNISYRELVASTCIGIMQLWWHPYLHDLKKLLPFLFLYNMFSIFVGYPMFYMELAVGAVTKKSVLNCWDMSPFSRGIGISMLITAVFTALATGAVAAWCLAMLVHSFHSFLPWLHCAARAVPACAARHRPMPENSETPPQSFFFNYVLQLKRDGLDGGLGTIVKELAIYYTLCWILIYCITFKRIYGISKLMTFKDVLAYFVLICAAVGCLRLDGAGRMFRVADWSVMLTECQIWREAAEFALIQMSVSQGTLVLLGSHCPRPRHALARTALVAFIASKTTCMMTALTLGAAHGALMKDYEAYPNIRNESSSSIVLWADYVARIPGSQFWSAIVFFTLWVLALTSTALLVHTIMSAFTGRSIRKIAWAFLVLICVLFGLIGIIFVCSQGSLYIVTFVMRWLVLKPRIVLSSLVALIVTYSYGQMTFCEDVYFAVGEYPNMFLRICWATGPSVLLVLFLCNLFVWIPRESTAGWVLVAMVLMPVFLVMFIYLFFKFRVRNIVGSEK